MEATDVGARRSMIASATAEADKQPNAERIQLRWRDSEYAATVVKLPVERLVLNPRSHRIRAQLESLDQYSTIFKEPFSKAAQSEIAGILRESEYFDELRQNLKDVGQLEPGVVTADGMLVNANTRCVALRDNNRKYIRAAVLPSDADQKEIDRLELSLQMKRDFRSSYTYSNELLFVYDLVHTHGYKPRDVAIEMGWASASEKRQLLKSSELVEQYLHILSLIRELQSLSDAKIRLTRFDSNRQALTEIDDEITTLKRTDQAAADELKFARLAAMLTEVGYREMREIDQNFVANYLVPAMEDRPALKPHIDALTASMAQDSSQDPAGLSLFEEFDVKPVRQERSARIMLEAILQSEGDDEIVVSVVDNQVTRLPRALFCTELKGAFEDAAGDAQLDRKEGDTLARPIELLRKATRQINAAAQAHDSVKDHPEFDIDRMSNSVDDLRTASGALLSRFTDRNSTP